MHSLIALYSHSMFHLLIFNIFFKYAPEKKNKMGDNYVFIQGWVMVFAQNTHPLITLYLSSIWLYIARGLVKEDVFGDNCGIFFSYFSMKNIHVYCGYSLKAPHWGTSNEHPQHMSLTRTGDNYPIIIKEYLEIIQGFFFLYSFLHKNLHCSYS